MLFSVEAVGDEEIDVRCSVRLDRGTSGRIKLPPESAQVEPQEVAGFSISPSLHLDELDNMPFAGQVMIICRGASVASPERIQFETLGPLYFHPDLDPATLAPALIWFPAARLKQHNAGDFRGAIELPPGTALPQRFVEDDPDYMPAGPEVQDANG